MIQFTFQDLQAEESRMTLSVEEMIRAAIERGDFDSLSKKGKKPDLDDYFQTPEDLRVGYSVLKNSDFLPEEVVLLREIAELQEKLLNSNAEPERIKLVKEIQERRLRYSLLMERFNRHRAV